MLIIAVCCNGGIAANGCSVAVNTAEAAAGTGNDVCLVSTGKHGRCAGGICSGSGGCGVTVTGCTACISCCYAPVDRCAAAVATAAVTVAVGGGTIAVAAGRPLVTLEVGGAGKLRCIGAVGRGATAGGTEAEEDGCI